MLAGVAETVACACKLMPASAHPPRNTRKIQPAVPVPNPLSPVARSGMPLNNCGLDVHVDLKPTKQENRLLITDTPIPHELNRWNYAKGGCETKQGGVLVLSTKMHGSSLGMAGVYLFAT